MLPTLILGSAEQLLLNLLEKIVGNLLWTLTFRGILGKLFLLFFFSRNKDWKANYRTAFHLNMLSTPTDKSHTSPKYIPVTDDHIVSLTDSGNFGFFPESSPCRSLAIQDKEFMSECSNDLDSDTMERMNQFSLRRGSVRHNKSKLATKQTLDLMRSAWRLSKEAPTPCVTVWSKETASPWDAGRSPCIFPGPGAL